VEGNVALRSKTETADPLGPAVTQMVPRRGVQSDDPNVLGLIALLTLGDVELDGLSFVEGLVALGLDVGEVNEHIVATLT